MITQTSDSHQIPCQDKTKSKVTNFKILLKFQITVGATERTRDVGQMYGQMDGLSETNIPPPPPPRQQLHCAGSIIIYIMTIFMKSYFTRLQVLCAYCCSMEIPYWLKDMRISISYKIQWHHQIMTSCTPTYFHLYILVQRGYWIVND